MLITGHTGFAGSWLAATLENLGAVATGISLPPLKPALFPLLAPRLSRLTSHIADIRDLAAIAPLVKQAEPEIVFHLAAESLVRRAHANPVATFATNMLGTVHLLEALREAPSTRAVAVFTTDKVYANHESAAAYRESDALGGSEPYGASKAGAELAASAYYHAYLRKNNVGVATVRAGNIIGGGDFSTDRLVPDFARAVLQGTSLALRHPKATRPWQFVMEAVNATLLLAERLHGEPRGYSEAWNVGPPLENTVTVAALVEQLQAAWSTVDVRWQKEASAPHEANMLSIDSSKLSVRLGWQPTWTMTRAIGATAAWYKAYAAKADVAALTFQQIEEFLDVAPAHA